MAKKIGRGGKSIKGPFFVSPEVFRMSTKKACKAGHTFYYIFKVKPFKAKPVLACADKPAVIFPHSTTPSQPGGQRWIWLLLHLQFMDYTSIAQPDMRNIVIHTVNKGGTN